MFLTSKKFKIREAWMEWLMNENIDNLQSYVNARNSHLSDRIKECERRLDIIDIRCPCSIDNKDYGNGITPVSDETLNHFKKINPPRSS